MLMGYNSNNGGREGRRRVINVLVQLYRYASTQIDNKVRSEQSPHVAEQKNVASTLDCIARFSLLSTLKMRS